MTNARTPGARCYGYVTMATSEDASKCIQHLHRTELHGRMISVEKVRYCDIDLRRIACHLSLSFIVHCALMES